MEIIFHDVKRKWDDHLNDMETWMKQRGGEGSLFVVHSVWKGVRRDPC
jgi:hypothetical protein